MFIKDINYHAAISKLAQEMHSIFLELQDLTQSKTSVIDALQGNILVPYEQRISTLDQQFSELVNHFGVSAKEAEKDLDDELMKINHAQVVLGTHKTVQ